jgi:diguanylate cyclase (GGDEF)-like protein/PAS domain S-box-containing protein
MSRKVSLNNRFIIVVIAISVLILLVVTYSQTLVNKTAHNSLQTSQNSRQLVEKIRNIKYSIQEIERNIYQYTILSDNSLRLSLIKRKEILNNQIIKLNSLWSSIEFNHSNNNSNHLLNQLQKRSLLLEQQLDYFLKITASIETIFPGMPILTQQLLPLNIMFLEEITIAIEESNIFPDSQNNHKVKTLFENTRYAWAQQISLVRLFVANRLGTFGDPVTSMELNLINRNFYIQIIKENLEQLSTLNDQGLLEIQQSDSLIHILDIVERYENNFKKVQVVYLSELWRNDLVLLKNQLQPLFAILWNTINLIENDLNKYIDYSAVLSNQAVNMISIFIWIFTTTILLLLISGYFTFNVIIRKPIQNVAKALDSVANGQHVNQKIKAHAIETDLLVNAFHNMQSQVKSRQNRLESILETAGEGIITIDEQGIIETFNKAAQIIFGYQSSEIIGKNLTLLISRTEFTNNDQFVTIRRKLALNNSNKKNNEVIAKRKNNTTFPLLIKMSELVADGKKLYTAIVEDVSERKAMLDNLQKIAEHDSLTELYNRFYFMNELERLTERLKRNRKTSSALFYIDLDNFKYINDTLGHLAGDQLLIEVSILFTAKLRSIDLIARLGGDEFAVIIYDVTEDVAVKIANILRQNMQDYVFNYKKSSIQIGCSIGIAMFDQYIMNKEDLLSRADFACFAAKKAGRNLIHVYSHSDDEKRDILSSDIGWTKRIKNALQNNRFVFIKQPIYDIKNQKITKYEVLTRMLDESGEQIIPSVFLPIAERFGLINEIDIWVVKHAIKDLSQLIKKSKNISYSINLSAKSFDNDEIISCITHEIEINNISPSLLIFEITETAAIADVGLTVKFIKKLQKLGCKIALDDFGVGYSSFSYLKNLPIDFVKIDGSFIQDISKNEVCLTIVKSINDISHALGKKTIAEFAEDQTTLNLLTEIGIDYAQGFYIEKFESQYNHNKSLIEIN